MGVGVQPEPIDQGNLDDWAANSRQEGDCKTLQLSS